MPLPDAVKPPILQPAAPDPAEPARFYDTSVSTLRWFHRVLLTGSLIILAGAASMHIRQQQQVILPLVNEPLPGVCTFQRLTGYPCPGCGLTRSFISLAHGQLRAAWWYNPAGILFFAIVVFQVPFRTYQLWRLRRGRGEFHFRRADRWAVLVLVITLLLQWVTRIVFAGH